MAPLVWLVTGTSSGIGKTMVHSILKRGDKIIATGRNAAERLAFYKDMDGVSVVDLDLCADEDTIDKAVAQAVAVHGRIDVLVNNAGSLSFGTVEEMRDVQMRKVFDVNVFGTMKVTRAVLPHMRKQKSGNIVTIGSQYGWWGAPGVGAYGASKHALESYTESLQLELSPFNIRATIFEPGFFNTGGLDPTKLVSALPEHIIADYAPIHAAMMAASESITNKERGDPVKLCEMMIDFVKGEGLVSEKRAGGEWKAPLRMPVGDDALNLMIQQCQRTIKLCEEWKDVVVQSDRDDYVPDPRSAAMTTVREA